MAFFSPSHVFINCSFHERDCNECGFSSLSGRSDYVALVDCNDDMTNHLAGCHLSKSVLKEHEVILARAGIFRWTEGQVKEMVICPKHRDRYGKYWRSATMCQYLVHKGKSQAIKQGRNMRVINLEMAIQTMDMYGVTVSIGSREF